MKLKLPVNKVYRLLLLVVIIVILLFILFSITKRYFNSPSVGTINSTTTNTPKATSLLSAEGKTFTFSYDSAFRPVQSDSLGSGDVEKFNYVAMQTSPWNLGIQIRNLASGQISNDGSYNLRKTNPKVYTEQLVTLNSNVAYIMTSNAGGYNKTAFIVHKNLDAAITLTSNSSADSQKLDDALNQILFSWQWL